VRRPREQAGYTVVELLVGMMVLGVVAVGAMTMMEVVMRQGRGVVDRTEAAQRGRLVLDAITRQVRSQVCKDATTKGLVAATPDSLTFYADLSDGSTPPARRKLEYQAGSRQIVETVYQANEVTVARQTVLLSNVVRSRDPDPAVPAEDPPPFFSYWKYPDPPTATAEPVRVTSAAELGRIAVIRVNFSVRPHAATDDKFNTALSDRIVLRNADPNATNNDPTCI
jgi:prepilin-type N-terminal cleavage/methylation domain-containing protein